MRPWILFISFVLPLAACLNEAEEEVTWQGYVESDRLLVAAQVGGRIMRVEVIEGQEVAAGDTLFVLDDTEAVALAQEARAQLGAARARALDLRKGKRPEELAVVQAQIDEARAGAELAQHELERQRNLAKTQAGTRQSLDTAKANADAAAARLAALEADLAVARMAARPEQLEAAEQEVERAQAALAAAEWRQAQNVVRAPVAGRIEQQLYRVGEVPQAGSPVLLMLPRDGLKLVTFVPEPARASVHVGQTLAIGCDGCATGLEARVRFLAADPEFTPPVIYSIGSRASLVYRIEADLLGEAAHLTVGQPIDVEPPGAGPRAKP